ncbi:unnamed protein product [Clonostachys rhizophaga]|uniref:Zn(2)-C6 fungal-type domain-containing protein n=1 Tax=Clonostachys rhizophaga TaxID=160324 RepID=A0A9N9VX35_9HYPO|nr:unnamed protein product [Clonostachys rhizophaga]
MKRARFLDSEDPQGSDESRQHQPKISRRIRACQRCQSRKVKCDIEPSQSKCVRCLRIGAECIFNKNLQAVLEDRSDWREGVESQLQLLQTSLADVQSQLASLRASQGLELPVARSTPNTSPNQSLPTPNVTAMTRENSPDNMNDGESDAEARDDQVIVGAPMASLFKVTRLRNIRSDPGSHRHGPVTSDRGQPMDFIDEDRACLADAEKLFTTFKGTLNAYLWGGVVLAHDTLASARQSSPLLVAAILAVTALHTQDEGQSFDRYYPILLEIAGQSLFQRYHNLDDIRGLCIGAFWLSDVSWKLSGLAVRIATELNIHQSCAKALRGDATHFEKARLWYVLYVCDHHFSIAYGRPPVINEDMTITNHQAFLDLPGATKSDIRLHSQVGIFMILSRVDCSFGPDRSRLVANDEFESIRRYGADIDQWRRKWEQRLDPNPDIGDYPAKGVTLHYHFARLQLFGSASSALHLILEDPDIRKAVVGVPLYLLTTISHASIFLMKVHSKWRSANFQVGFHEIVHLIEATVVLLDDTRGCSRHVNQYIANGLRSMLEKFRRWETSNELQMHAPANDSNMLLGWNESRQGWGTETDWGFSGAGLSDQFGFGSDYYHMDLLGILGSQMPES